ncbi:TRAP transporter substrate-binding protein [Vallitaleaceae bacterium 9-2]
MKKLILVLCLVLSMVVPTGCSNSNESEAGENTPITLKLADNQPLSSPLAQSGEKFAELVNEKTNGQVQIEVYPNAQLGEEAETTEQVKAGVLDFARINVVQLTQYVDGYEALTLPYMFNDDAHRWAAVDGSVGKALNEEMLEKTGVYVLNYLSSGWRSFYTMEKAVSLADLAGKKIRVMDSAANINMITALNATATPMPYADVFTALQTGVIDSAENDFVSYTTSGHYEVAKYYMEDRHTAGFCNLIMSATVKEKLTDEQFELVKEAAQEAAIWQREAMIKAQEESKQEAIEAGCEFTQVNIQEFQDAVAPMYADYDYLESIIEEIKGYKY